MPATTDCRFQKLRAQGYAGATPDMLLLWLRDWGVPAPTLTDGWAQMLKLHGYSGARSDAWYTFLGDMGMTGAINDREHQYWCTTSALPLPAPSGGAFSSDFNGDFS